MSEDYLRNKIVGQPLKPKWRIKKKEKVGFNRLQIVECLLKNPPLKITELAWEIPRSLQNLHENLRVLVDNEIVCSKIDMSDAKRYFAVCPSCPLKQECEEKLDFWLKSGLMEENMNEPRN